MKCPEIITRGMLTRKFREKARAERGSSRQPVISSHALGNDVSAGRRDFFGAVMGRRARRTARRPPARLVPSRAKIPPVVRQQRKDTSKSALQFGPPSRSSPSTDAARDPGTSPSAVAGPAASPSRRSPRLMNRRSSPAERTRR